MPIVKSNNLWFSKEYKHVIKLCLNCNKLLILNNNRDIVRKKFCCVSCSAKYNTRIGKIGTKFKHFSEDTKMKMREKKLGLYDGKNNPRYKDGSYVGLSKYRKRALSKFENKCVICKTDKILVVHHIDFNRTNNNLSNLVIVCRRCHSNIHLGNIELGGELYTNRI